MNFLGSFIYCCIDGKLLIPVNSTDCEGVWRTSKGTLWNKSPDSRPSVSPIMTNPNSLNSISFFCEGKRELLPASLIRTDPATFMLQYLLMRISCLHKATVESLNLLGSNRILKKSRPVSSQAKVPIPIGSSEELITGLFYFVKSFHSTF